ncbi:MAG: glutaredoxin [Rickettsiaceae bacterium]|nr:glutaredoxin [Rickettsiaceae bacterium]
MILVLFHKISCLSLRYARSLIILGLGFCFLAYAKSPCNGHKIQSFTTQSCIFCKKLKIELELANLEYEDRDITSNYLIYHWLKAKTGQKTVPFVFINDKHIGGYTDFVRICLESSKD